MAKTLLHDPDRTTYASIAKQLGVSRQKVWGWFQPGRRVPPRWVLDVEAATGIPKEQLRPDIFKPGRSIPPTGREAGR